MSSCSPEPPVFDKSPYFKLQNMSYGGRSLFATCDIDPGTRVHSSQAPFAHIIYKDYKKEVCAQCFAYSASDQTPPTVGASRTWRVKWSRAGATAWFCSDVCKDEWERDEVSPLLMEVDALLTKGQVATRKRFKSVEEEARAKAIFPSFEPGGEGTITQRAIDEAWASAETLVASRAQLAIFFSTLRLEDMELEIARSLAGAVIRRYRDERLSSDPILKVTKNQTESWAQLLNLQSNELFNIRTRPYMLIAHLRIYVFLSNVLPEYLRKYMSTVREVLARDTGNAFGIWDGDRRDEMMGWGIWVSASYFNHSCTPNVVKKREGRVLHFEAVRKIRGGEELCISYTDTDSSVEKRRAELEASWFFTCRCLRCESESKVESSVATSG